MNQAIRSAAHDGGVKLWQIAERWGCTDGNFSRKLRHQFSPAEEKRALEIIEQIKHQVGTQHTGPTLTGFVEAQHETT